MTPTDVIGIKHIDILPISIGKYTQNQLDKQVYYRDLYIRTFIIQSICMHFSP